MNSAQSGLTDYHLEHLEADGHFEEMRIHRDEALELEIFREGVKNERKQGSGFDFDFDRYLAIHLDPNMQKRSRTLQGTLQRVENKPRQPVLEATWQAFVVRSRG